MMTTISAPLADAVANGAHCLLNAGQNRHLGFDARGCNSLYVFLDPSF